MIDEVTQRPSLQQQQMSTMERTVAGVSNTPKSDQNQPQQAQYAQQAQQPQKANLGADLCPYCGSELDIGADFCEVCHHYIKKDVCSFCGAPISLTDSFCPECGSPRGGIVCPVCHTLNDFSFCKQCGTALTDDARHLVAQLKMQPEYQELVTLAKEYDDLMMKKPVASERDKVREEDSMRLRERVLKLLAQDAGEPDPVIPEVKEKHMSKQELDSKKEEKLARLTELLNMMAIPPQPTPAHVRNFAMAQKPAGVRLAWVCNWKHAMHSSPCGCAKPQLGGQWVILGRGAKQEIKDDK